MIRYSVVDKFGNIRLPEWVHKKLGLKELDKVEFIEKDGGILVRKIEPLSNQEFEEMLEKVRESFREIGYTEDQMMEDLERVRKEMWEEYKHKYAHMIKSPPKQSSRKDFEEIIFQMGEYRRYNDPFRNTPGMKKVKFVGKKLGNHKVYNGKTVGETDRYVDYFLFLTKKGKYLLIENHWTAWYPEESCFIDYKIFDSLDNLQGKVPDGLIDDARRELGEVEDVKIEDEVISLDI